MNHDHNTRVHKIKKESTVQTWRKQTKFPEVTKLPPARLYNYTPFNIHVEDQKALDHIPYFDDETATEGNSFIQDIIDVHDGNIHSAMVIEDDDFFIDLVRRLNKSIRTRDHSLSAKKTRSNINSAVSIAEIVFQAISHAFPSEGSPVDVKSRYTKLITSKPPCFNPNIDGPSANSTDRLKSLHSYKTLFCRRCLIYDCHLHTREQDLSPDKLSTITIRNRDDFIDHTPTPLHPCSEDCFMHILKHSSSLPEPAYTAITKAEESIIRAEWVSSRANFCLLKLFTLRKSVSCAMVYTWCKKNIPDFNVFVDSGSKYITRSVSNDTNGNATREAMSCDDDSNSGNSGASEDRLSASGDTQESKISRSTRPNNKRKGSSSTRNGKGKRKVRNTFFKINQLKSKLSDNSVHNYSPCIDHIGEECSNDCECIINGHGCEKYCLCSSKCQYRMPGCVCSGNCNTGQCPCFKASRECDPDLCKSCGSSDFVDPKCCNVALQRKKKKHLLIAPSDLGFEAGWGCFTKDRILKNELISEYCGELISQVEADRRGMIYDKYKISYLFQLNSEFAVDATIKGNKIRFANHSVTPNCYAKIFSVIGEHRIGIFAARDIEEGEELFFDYKYANNERLTFVPIEQHVPMKQPSSINGMRAPCSINGKGSHTPKTLTNGHQNSPLPKSNSQPVAITSRPQYAIKSTVRISIPANRPK